jgi:hypothetical protein
LWLPWQLKEQSADSISVLEGALRLHKDFYVHNVRTLDLLGADAAGTANGETEASTAGLRISAHELHCQVGGACGGRGLWWPRQRRACFVG